MSAAFEIIIWSFKTVFAKPLTTFKVAWPPLLLLFAASALQTFLDLKRLSDTAPIPIFRVAERETGGSEFSVQFFTIFALIPPTAIVFSAIGVVWLAIRWHRFQIIASHSLGGARVVFSYALHALPLSLLIAAALVLPPIFLGYLSEYHLFASWSAALYVVMRASPVLPASAVAAPIGFISAWKMTRPFAFTCLLLTIFRLLFFAVITALDTVLFQLWLPWIIVMSTTSFLFAIDILISVSLITQLYVRVTDSA